MEVVTEDVMDAAGVGVMVEDYSIQGICIETPCQERSMVSLVKNEIKDRVIDLIED